MNYKNHIRHMEAFNIKNKGRKCNLCGRTISYGAHHLMHDRCWRLKGTDEVKYIIRQAEIEGRFFDKDTGKWIIVNVDEIEKRCENCKELNLENNLHSPRCEGCVSEEFWIFNIKLVKERDDGK